MRQKQRQPYRVCRAGGQRFPIYLAYDLALAEMYPVYPDFETRPAYTGEGRPFATAAQESCSFRKAKNPGESLPGDCGGCGWFFREETPCDPIGICLCDARRRETESDKEETK